MDKFGILVIWLVKTGMAAGIAYALILFLEWLAEWSLENLVITFG